MKNLIEELRKVIDYLWDTAKEPYLSDVVGFACDELEECRWIPVSERLPKVYETVILHQTGTRTVASVIPGILTISYGEKKWYTIGGSELRGVEHWMTFPKPPKEEE